VAGILTLNGCGESAPGKPDLPQSVSPGWAQKSFGQAAPPAGLPETSKPDCWKAVYAGKGSAEVWTCGYGNKGGAFDAAQRARAEADTVKFQEGKYLVIVKWSGSSREEITALVRALQKSMGVNSR
jgi:hypothetical protein